MVFVLVVVVVRVVPVLGLVRSEALLVEPVHRWMALCLDLLEIPMDHG